MIKRNKYITLPVFLIGSTLSISACTDGKIKTEAKYPTSSNRQMNSNSSDIYSKGGSVFGKDGLSILGGNKKASSSDDNGIGVNSFLWRATLDTVSFMPLASADPFGGVILTDWYIDPNAKDERVKINAFIMDRELKASGIKVRTFRQVNKSGAWVDAKVSEDTARKLDDTILTRARQMRVAHLADEK